MASRILINFFILLLLIPQLASAGSFSVGGIRINKDIKPMRDIKRENVVTQSLDFSCGAAGLSTLLNYYLDDKVTETEIINTLLNTVPLEKVKARRGFSLLDLKNFAKSKGYKVTGYKMDSDFLRDLKRPVLVPIKFKNYQHFVIVKGIIGDRIFLADPAAGNVSMKLVKFEKMWLDGIGLVLESKKKKNLVEYALKVHENDFLFADSKMMRRLIDPTLIRTAIFPGEF